MKIYKFEADWCNQCKQLAKNIEKDVPEDIKALIEVVNVDTNEELANKYKVRSLPTLSFVDDNGVELLRITGAISGKLFMEKYNALNENS